MKNKYLKGITAILILTVLLVMWFLNSTTKAEADLCSALNSNCINANDKSCCNPNICRLGVAGEPSAGNYKCREDIVTPTPVTPTPTSTPTPTPENQVLCHRIQRDVCEEKELGNCSENEWLEGGCPTPTPTATPTPEVTQTPSQPSSQGGSGTSDGRSDGLGCGSHDCSNQAQTSNTATGPQVLGASTGPQVLGLSTTSSGSSSALSLIQLALGFGFISSGFKLFRKHA